VVDDSRRRGRDVAVDANSAMMLGMDDGLVGMGAVGEGYAPRAAPRDDACSNRTTQLYGKCANRVTIDEVVESDIQGYVAI
jgi:hypothetical protein